MSKIRVSRLIKKIGITFVIPILMLIFGAIIVLTSAWNMITQSYTLGSMLFNKPSVVLSEKKYDIGNKVINRPGIGEKFADLIIPSLDFDKPVLHGDSPTELRKGIGHFAGSTLPGENGNIVISAHRDGVFYPLKDIKVGDEVILKVTYGSFKYKVSQIKIVEKTDHSEVGVLDHERLTMYTCYPFNFIGDAPQRMMVICDFVGSI